MTKESQPFNILVAGEKASKLPVRLDCDSNAPLGEDILKRLRSTGNYGQNPVIVTAANSNRNKANAARHAALSGFSKPSTLLQMELQDRHPHESNSDRTSRGQQ